MKILYSSADVRKAIVELFSLSKGRRVAVVAFVGRGAKACLPKPKGLELFCWPKEGGTNPDVLRDLLKNCVLTSKSHLRPNLCLQQTYTEN